MAELTYKDYYVFFGERGKDAVDIIEDSFMKGTGSPTLILKRNKNNIKQVKQKTVPEPILRAKAYGETHKELNLPPFRIEVGDTIFDLGGTPYTFNYDRENDSAILTKHEDSEEKPAKRKITKKQDGDSAYYEAVVDDSEELDETVLGDKKSGNKKQTRPKYSRGIRKEASFKGIVREYEVVDSKTERYVKEGIIKEEDIKYDKTAKKIINIYPRSSRYYIYFDKEGRPTDKYKVDKEAIMKSKNDEPYYNPLKTRWKKFGSEKAKTGATTTRKRNTKKSSGISLTPKVSTKAFKMNIIPKAKNTNKISNPTGISVSIPKVGKFKLKGFKQPRLKL